MRYYVFQMKNLDNNFTTVWAMGIEFAPSPNNLNEIITQELRASIMRDPRMESANLKLGVIVEDFGSATEAQAFIDDSLGRAEILFFGEKVPLDPGS